MPKVDKGRIDLDAQVQYDKSLQGKEIDAIDKKAGVDFKDEGVVRAKMGGQNLICKGMRVPSDKFKNRYDKIAWYCDKCGKHHIKGVDC